MFLNGNNLGERHRDLNSIVSEAVATQTNFEELKCQPEKCDVDKLIKIDVASKYKNVDYILEVLKCGDTFYITRGLKCLWLYSDEYSQFINPSYLDTNIFPYMSMKMKRKMLTTISMHMRNSDRAIEFYKYCKDAKLNNHAVKFLVFTPDSYKLEILKSRTNFDNFDESKFLKQFIGSSFVLALAYLALRNYASQIIHKLRFLYSVSDEEYLDILEKYAPNNARYPQCTQVLGIRVSKDILIKHKQRILKKPVIYINILTKNMLIKHLTPEDVEKLGPGLLPQSTYDFWSLDVCSTYNFILRKIPANKLYSYLKNIYISQYDDADFEMRIEFYRLKYYEMLDLEEREAWALRHIERDRELPGIKNYIWYKFVSFPKAISGIKRYIFLTPDKNERSQIINILPETARNQDDINKILSYYYERHVNESEEHKESFIDKVIEHHDIYLFNDECWTLLDQLFYSLDVYTTDAYTKRGYKFRSLIYHVLHEIELPEGLREYINNISQFYHLKPIIIKLSEERKDIVAKYLILFCAEKIKSLMDQPDYDKEQIWYLIRKIQNLIYCFERCNDDLPEIAVQFMEANKSVYQINYDYQYTAKFVEQTEGDFVRWLKKDIQMAVDGISYITNNAYRWNFRLCRLFRKLKVYFPDDVGEEYLDYFMEYLSDIPEGRREYRNIKMAVVGVYYLASPDSIASFLENHVPTSPKIDHKNIDNRLLQVQKAICRLAYHPRPPLPLSIMQKYITGDYVHYCLPMFYSYFANLPSNVKFIETLLDAPLSIQKHGLRLAFKSYDPETLKPIIISAWKKTKNVSLRMVLYETLFNRILNESKEVQNELYEVLKLYTSELTHDDQDSVYSLLVSDNLPDVFKGDFTETAWLSVSKLSNKSIDIKRRINIICFMEKCIHLVQRDFVRHQIIDEHVTDMLCKKRITEDHDEYYFEVLINSKWNLTAKYIVSFNNEDEKQKSLHLMRTIMLECLQSWSVVKMKTYVVRKFIQSFIKTIMNKDPKTIESCTHIVCIYECILDSLKSFLKNVEIYLMIWELKLAIICRNIIHNGRKKGDTEAESRNMSWMEIAESYGKEVSCIIERLVKDDEFYRSLYQPIADIVNNIGHTICSILDIGYYGFVYYVCDSLIDTKMTETHLLALCVLPRDPVNNWDGKHREIITKIQNQFVSHEVHSYLYEKYVLSDCYVRHYVT